MSLLSIKSKIDIPSDWEMVPIGKVVVSSQYGTSSGNSEIGVPIIGMKNLQEGKVNFDDFPLVSVDEAEKEKLLLHKGDILLNRTNSYDLVGKVGYVDQDYEAVFASYLVRLEVDKTKTDPKFVAIWLSSFWADQMIKKIATRAVSQANVNPTEFKKFCLIPVLPLPEQTAIVDLLSTWDEAIEKTERLVKAKERRFKWLLRELISEPQNASEGMGWKKTKFKNIFKPNHRKNANNAKLPVLSVTTNGIVFQSEYFKKEVASDDKSVYWVVENGDFVMSGLNFWMGSVDFQTICDAGLVSPAYKVFKLISGSCIPKYLHHFIKSKEMIKILDRSSVQGASIVRRNLDIDALSNSYIYLPSEDIQLKIAEILTFAQQEIDMLKQLLDKYKTQKRGLMQKMLTGEWRLKPEVVKKYTEV